MLTTRSRMTGHDGDVERLLKSLRTQGQKHYIVTGDAIGSRFHGIPIVDIVDASYLGLLRSLFIAASANKCIVHGGAVRDLLSSIAPVDIDIIIDVNNLDSFLDALREFAEIEYTQSGSATTEHDKRYRVWMEPKGRRPYSYAATLVLDISTPLWVDLRELPADFDVNMLYIEKYTYNYNGHNGSIRVVNGRIVTDWCEIAMRMPYGVPVLPMDQTPVDGSREVDYTAILNNIRAKKTSINHKCKKSHVLMPLSDKERRIAAIRAAGYEDITVYGCDNVNCRLARLDLVIKHTWRSLENLSDTNFTTWRYAMQAVVSERPFVDDLNERIEQLSSIWLRNAHAAEDRKDVGQFVYDNLDVAQILAKHLPPIPRIIKPDLRTMTDCVRTRSAFVCAIGAWEDIAGEIKHTLSLAKARAIGPHACPAPMPLCSAATPPSQVASRAALSEICAKDNETSTRTVTHATLNDGEY